MGAEHRNGIYRRNIPLFYITTTLRSLWFVTSVWVAFERRYITTWEMVVVEALALAIQLVMELPTGALADLLGKRVTVVTSYVLYGISLVFYANCRSFSAFLFYAIIFGIAEACVSGALEALLYDTLKQAGKEKDFSRLQSKISVYFQVGLAFATVLGGYIATFSFEWTMYLTATTLFLAGVASIFYREPVVDTERFTLRRYIHQTKLGVKELVKNEHIALVSLYYIAVGTISWSCVMVFNMMLLTDVGFKPNEIGITVALIRIVNTTLLYKLISKTRFLTRSRVYVLFPFVMGVSLIPGVILSKIGSAFSIAGTTISSTARWNILGQYTNAEFDSKNRATAISALSMAIGIFYVIIMLISGPIMERFGGPKTMFSVLGVLTLVTILPLGLILRRQHGKIEQI